MADTSSPLLTHPPLEIQIFLRNSEIVENAFETLRKKYSIKAKRHTLYSNLVLFKYMNLSVDFSERIVQECRGIILDEDRDWQVVALPYFKFFNHGEPLAAKLSGKISFYEKEDGSLMTLYFYDGGWHVASSGTPDASGDAVKNVTFKELFWQVFNERGYPLPRDTTKVYIFELLTPTNQIVVDQPTNRLILHGVRCVYSLRESSPEDYSGNYHTIKEYVFQDINECVDAAKVINYKSHEGFIAVDEKFNRLKIKSPDYVLNAHIRTKSESITDENVLSVMLFGETSEFLNTFPGVTDRFNEMKIYIDNVIDNINEKYLSVQNTPRRDLNALLAEYPFKSCIFTMKSGNSAISALAKLGAKNILSKKL